VKPNAFLAQLSKKSGHPRPAAASTKCRYQMHHVFQNFIDLLSSAKDPASFSEAISVTAAALDLSCFAYLALPRKQTSRDQSQHSLSHRHQNLASGISNGKTGVFRDDDVLRELSRRRT
jgi:hypothetical protein